MRTEMAAMQASLQQQFQEQMAAMMALLQQQQQQQPSAADHTDPKAKPSSKASAPAFLAPELTTPEEPSAHTEQTQPTEPTTQPTQPEEDEIEYIELQGDEVRENLQGATVNEVCSLHGAPQVYDGSLWFFFWSPTHELQP